MVVHGWCDGGSCTLISEDEYDEGHEGDDGVVGGNEEMNNADVTGEGAVKEGRGGREGRVEEGQHISGGKGGSFIDIAGPSPMKSRVEEPDGVGRKLCSCLHFDSLRLSISLGRLVKPSVAEIGDFVDANAFFF